MASEPGIEGRVLNLRVKNIAMIAYACKLVVGEYRVPNSKVARSLDEHAKVSIRVCN